MTPRSVLIAAAALASLLVRPDETRATLPTEHTVAVKITGELP